ncbi:hypothetical protein LTR02_017978 [Friedmanniomyces endolithicus]|nr:hypothetical protein LTR94_023698 [Friedmanniomyces endolithicus]KAK0769108.1 hypothetical protein LTR38_017972 [Friedmanniomyces endolithicus]KAK0824279.1 hypothetical protein LTR03_017759 [Friedmanniomyces endolithicus]KAK0886617.1 hypothetical protein LTR02_017978 [Friedmanniomyces endolithicus]KAK0890520.1 hypothetical protein LTR57_025101 [Friedmanniomyces endolithicus]
MEPYISKNVELAIARMAEDSKAKGFTDVFMWFMFMATDVISEASFAEFPLFFKTMQRVPFGPSKEIMRSIFRTRAYADESIQRYWKQLQADPDNVKTTLLTKEYAEVENGTIPADQLIRDAHGNIVAGTDTTAVTATYAIWFLAQDTRIQQALIEEVSTLPDGFKDNDLRSLRVMGGVLNETLRLRSAIGGSLPRLVPPGGAQFCGYFIPEKTVVGIPTWTMHRDPAVMQDPERFDPSRWYEPTKDMLHNFLPFGGGSRGEHFYLTSAFRVV